MRNFESGYAFLALLLILAITAQFSLMSFTLGHALQKRAAEEELLFIGRQFQRALRSYATATPAGQPRLPGSLQDLLYDPRSATPRRHLRRLFIDPLTATKDWGIVRNTNGTGILAIYSKAAGQPYKIANFGADFADFAGKRSYREWQFGLSAAELALE